MPVADRGFRYGMSVFETLAVHRGRLLFLNEHIDRLKQACGAAGFAFPPELSNSLSALRMNGEGMVRVYVTAGAGGPTDEAQACGTYALFDGMVFPSCGDVSRGYRAAFSRAPVSCVLGGWKTGNYWQHVQVLTEAKKQGLDEAFVLNTQGEVVSAAMANVFFVLNGTLQTPSAISGARDGVVRNWVQSQQHVQISSLLPEDASRAEECFLTNSRLGIMPVVEMEGRCLPSRKIGDELAAMYREKILGC